MRTILIISSIFVAGRAQAALGDETCSTARELGAPPIALDASLDSTPDAPDVDYYRFTGTPGETLIAEMRTSTSSPASAPLLGQFDSSCTLVGSSSSPGMIQARVLVTVPADGVVILAASANGDWSFTGGGFGPYHLEVRSYRTFPGVFASIVDAATGAPPPWSAYIVAFLYRCLSADCSELEFTNYVYPWDGQLSITTDWAGSALEAGAYQLQIYASGYSSQAIGFSAAEGEAVELGAIALVPVPRINSITGRVVDAGTLGPITDYAYVSLYFCPNGDCSLAQWVNYAYVDGWTDRFFFTSTYYGHPLEVGSYFVQISSQRYLPFTSSPIAGGEGEDVDFGELAIQPLPRIGSISGRLTDDLTGAPISGTVVIQSCGMFGCSWASESTGGDGLFRFERDEWGFSLFAGAYFIFAYADQYQGHALTVDVGENEHANLGDLALVSNPIRFTNVQPCASIPAGGGRCTYSVTVVNGRAGSFNGTAWSDVEGWNIGSFTGATRFQAGQRSIGFPSGALGQTRAVSFSFDVPASVQDYAAFCSSIWVSRGSSYLDTVGQRFLFCIQKDPVQNRFEVVTEEEARKRQNEKEPTRLLGNRAPAHRALLPPQQN